MQKNSSKFKLFPHQEKALDEILGAIAVGEEEILLYSLQGTGKTYISSALVLDRLQTLSFNEKIVISFAFTSLIAGFIDALKLAGIAQYVTILGDGNKVDTSKPIIVALQQSLISYEKKGIEFWGNTSLLIIDEAHVGYDKDRVIKSISYLNPTTVLKMTGTPYSSGCRSIVSDEAVVVKTLSYKECIKNGIIVPFKYVQSKLPYLLKLNEKTAKTDIDEADKYMPKINQIVDEFINNEFVDPSKKSIWFCPTTKFADMLSKKFREHGFPIYPYHSNIGKEENMRIMKSFKLNKPLQYKNETVLNFSSGKAEEERCIGICSVNSVSIGFSVNDIEIVGLCGTTLNRNTYMQRISRGNRAHPNKKECWVFDYALNLKTHGCMSKEDEFEPYNDVISNEYANRQLKEFVGHEYYDDCLVKDENTPEQMDGYIVGRRLAIFRDYSSNVAGEDVQSLMLRIKVANDDPMNIIIMTMSVMNQKYCKPMLDRWGNETRGYIVEKKTKDEKGKYVVTKKECSGFLNQKAIMNISEQWIKAITKDKERKDEYIKELKRVCLNVIKYVSNIWTIKFAIEKMDIYNSMIEAELVESYEKNYKMNSEKRKKSQPNALPVIHIDEDELPF